jgi:D-serine deaminase-like pyridoxal phosphate-dependent protein
MADAISGDRWFRFRGEEEVPSPALVVYPERVRENIKRMIAMAGGPARLRPHIKTHKMPKVMKLQQAAGLRRFKCATLAEAEMAAACGDFDILVAGQMVGPNIGRLLELSRRFPGARFSSLVDDAGAAAELGRAASKAGRAAEVWLDLDCGQHRTGIPPDAKAEEFYRWLGTVEGLRPIGLHAYDGHIHDRDPTARAVACETAFAPVVELRRKIAASSGSLPALVAGGTPTFPTHASHADRQCSPGTSVFWDAGYSANLPDLDFLPAALLLVRVVSKPGGNRLCLDLGHKAVASEGPPPRVVFPELPDARAVAHNEEHLVVETALAVETPVGRAFFGVPWHVCPTVALHSRAFVVEGGELRGTWSIPARERLLTFEKFGPANG